MSGITADPASGPSGVHTTTRSVRLQAVIRLASRQEVPFFGRGISSLGHSGFAPKRVIEVDCERRLLCSLDTLPAGCRATRKSARISAAVESSPPPHIPTAAKRLTSTHATRPTILARRRSELRGSRPVCWRIGSRRPRCAMPVIRTRDSARRERPEPHLAQTQALPRRTSGYQPPRARELVRLLRYSRL